MSKISSVMAGDTLVIVIDSETFNVGNDHPNRGAIVEALKTDETEGLVNLINMERAVQDYTQGKLQVEDGTVYYGDESLPSTITNRILDMLHEGFPIDPMVLFLDNLFENPSRQSVDETYDFLEANKLPITSDGHFLAYKRVRADFTDCHSGTFDNSVGSVCEMPRNKVQDNRDITCSTGLHFCGLSYLGSFWGDNVVIVKVNPRDVVSIPSDYNNAKGRACRYEVVGVHNAANVEETDAFDRAVQDNVGPEDRAVACVSPDVDMLIEVYDNVEDAAADMGCPVGYIRRVLTGDRERTQGYRWMYEDEWEDLVAI